MASQEKSDKHTEDSPPKTTNRHLRHALPFLTAFRFILISRFAMEIRRILENRIFNRENIIRMLECRGEEEACLYEYAGNLRKKTLGNYVYLRGLVEISNHCRKNCLYCGIRRDNSRVSRYSLSDAEIIEAAEKAYVRNYGSIVLQGGEICSPEFTRRMEELIRKIKKIGSRPLGITLSLGEQNEETYRRWFAAGAHRYLLRIESSNRNIFRDIHPADALHSYDTRLDCIKNLQKCGYQTGTGVMIGLPGQNTEDLCNDLMFIRENDIDMVGMGPYIEHSDTPLYAKRTTLLSPDERLKTAFHMIAAIRILMPDINIAATTALQALHPLGREKAVSIGANVIMPNLTPPIQCNAYKLYENKPETDEGSTLKELEKNLRKTGYEIKYSAWGDSLRFKKRVHF